jgi:hypothetical protein
VGSNSKPERGALIGLLVLGSFTVGVSACGVILGIEPGALLLGDGGTVDVAAQDVANSTDAPNGTEGGGNVCADGGADPYACNGRCGKVVDQCGHEVTCPAACTGAPTWSCNATNSTCECKVADEVWCPGRCGNAKDACGKAHDCKCPNNDCNELTGLCGGCVPNPTACGSRHCGSVSNGCAQVTCGVNGGGCASVNEVCTAEGVCCTPLSRQEACGGRCSGTASDRCGRDYDCTDTCLGVNQVCGAAEGTCCTKQGAECNPNSLINECCKPYSCAGAATQLAPLDGGTTFDSGTPKYYCQ